MKSSSLQLNPACIAYQRLYCDQQAEEILLEIFCNIETGE